MQMELAAAWAERAKESLPQERRVLSRVTQYFPDFPVHTE
jgi:hypothetical protein